MARMHKVKISTGSASMWTFLGKLIKLYPEKFDDPVKVRTMVNHPVHIPCKTLILLQQAMLEQHLFSHAELKEEVDYLKQRLTDIKSPLVFCHNDAMPANMVLKSDNTIALIDLEYGGPNHAAYDLANLFNEYIGCEEVLDYKRNYPNEFLIKDWIFSYLTEFAGQEPTKV